jgi:transposase
MQATHTANPKATLVIGLELSSSAWRAAISDGARPRASEHRFAAAQPQQRLMELVQCAAQLKAKWELPPDCDMTLVYEAGQDGFWIARALQDRGWQVRVADAASIPVARHARRAKTDRLDAQLLLQALLGWLRGENTRMHAVHVPEGEVEARRQLSRDRGELQKEIGQHRDRARKLLRTVGCWQELRAEPLAQLHAGELRCWDGQALPEELRGRLQREFERLQLVQQQFHALQRDLLGQLPAALREQIAQLASLRGVGWIGAMRLVLELYWRNFRNRRQVGACVGLVSQPYDSGDSRIDQGISKQGNRRVRALLIEMAWMWLRYQPQSELARWFAQRTASNASNKRGKRIAIVAVARRLAIALWRFLNAGVLPEGAELKRA